MSIHLGAKDGDIAQAVLLPGDPLRAKYIADTFLENATCYNEIRGMLGFTGTYKGTRVSVQGTGMGVPSISIYAQELMMNYQVQTLIRVGTCGGMHPDLHVRDVVLAMSASTDSAVNHIRFEGIDFAPTADFGLLHAAYGEAVRRELSVMAGGIFTSDTFYNDDTAGMERLRDYGVLAVEMETAALYTLAAKFGARALSILTVSDHIFTGATTTAEERQSTFSDMVEVALDTAVTAAETRMRG